MPIVVKPAPLLPISVLTATVVPPRGIAALPSPQTQATTVSLAAAAAPPRSPQSPIAAAAPTGRPAGAEAVALTPPSPVNPEPAAMAPSLPSAATAHSAQPRQAVAGPQRITPINPVPQNAPPVPIASASIPAVPPIAPAPPALDVRPGANVSPAGRAALDVTPARPQPSSLLPLPEPLAGREASAPAAPSTQRSLLRGGSEQPALPVISGEAGTATIGPVPPRSQPHPSLAILQAIAAAVRRNAAEPGVAGESESGERAATGPTSPIPATAAPSLDEVVAIGEQRLGREWLVTWLPLILPESTLPTRWLHRRADAGDGSEKRHGGSDRRFVAEATFETFGRVQVDGLVRPASRSIIVIVRSERALGDDHRAMIARIFQEGVELAGYGGEISYAPPPAVFVEPAATTEAGGRIGLVV